jgi:hypothetical protein
MKFVRYQHITNPSRNGETSLENWNKKAKETDLLLYWRKIEEFDKNEYVPSEAKKIMDKQINEGNEGIDFKKKGNISDGV